MSHIPATRAMHVFNGEVFYVLDDWKDRLASIGLTKDDDWSELTGKETVSSSYNTTSNFRFELDDGSSIFFKRYVYQKIRLKHWLQPSKATVEAAGFHDLEKLGIPTLQTIAYGERRRFGLLQASFIVTRGIDNVIELGQFMARRWFRMDTTSKRTTLQLLQPLLIKQLQIAHQAGFFHRDLKLRNILIHNYPENPELIWIDCPRSKRLPANDANGTIADFYSMARVACMVLTSGQQMRFLLDYYNGNRQQARQLYKAIAAELVKRPPRPYWHLLSPDDPVYIKNLNRQEQT